MGTDTNSNASAPKVDEPVNDSQKEQPMVQRFFTEDGTPVEPSTMLPKFEVGQVDPDSRPEVHERFVPADKADKIVNESELDDNDKK